MLEFRSIVQEAMDCPPQAFEAGCLLGIEGQSSSVRLAL